MMSHDSHSFGHRLKLFFIGGARNFNDNNIFHRISLIAFFAWIGLGADGLSSSCYGPAEAIIALGNYPYLGIFVAMLTALTISVISMSYSQTIELFPSGGGGYLVASKLHSPMVGMISGAALLIDYVLTISVSIASGTAALFSFFPGTGIEIKLIFASLGVLFLILINLRGVRESINLLAPIFLSFALSHLFVIVYALFSHFQDFGAVYAASSSNIGDAASNLGLFGTVFLVLRAFSMGAGTFTGIEAVSNGLPILREPRVKTGKRTMRYMAISLAFTAVGLMIAFFLFGIKPVQGKTLNAVLFENIALGWGEWGTIFVLFVLLTETAILFVAAQAGFIDGPRILSNMSLDRWMPSKFANLSDRLVTKNGILVMGISALAVILLSQGKVEFLIILYSINVFITFILTESGMVRHWWQVRHYEGKWKRKMAINLIALILDIFILTTIIIMKFHDGGWLTIVITGLLVIVALLIKRHYEKINGLIKGYDEILRSIDNYVPVKDEELNTDKTAIILVNGYNGLGMHTLFKLMTTLGSIFKRYVFIQVGVIDSGNFKGSGDVDKLREHLNSELTKYVEFIEKHGFDSEKYSSIGVNALDEIEKIVIELRSYYLDSVVFCGQLLFKKEIFWTRLMHNNIAFALQRRFHSLNIPFMVLPIQI